MQTIQINRGARMKKLQLGNLKEGDIFYYGKDKVKMQKISNSECLVCETGELEEMRIDMFVCVEVKS